MVAVGLRNRSKFHSCVFVRSDNERKQPCRQTKGRFTSRIMLSPTGFHTWRGDFCRSSVSRGLNPLFRWSGSGPKMGKGKETSRASRIHKTMTWASKAQGERRAKCLVAFKMNISDSINKRIGTGVRKRTGPHIPNRLLGHLPV